MGWVLNNNSTNIYIYIYIERERERGRERERDGKLGELDWVGFRLKTGSNKK